jgi:Bifunctional DNA primase/polymerase, N-terminal/Primase C terminal 1 (PriCT-1)
MSVLTTAIGFVRRSMPVLLVGEDKAPLGDLHPNGLHTPLRTPEDCRRACAMHPEGQLAVVTGPVSGLTVLDADGIDGAAALDDLADELGRLPSTTMVLTPRPGMHYWTWTAAQEISSRIGLKPKLDVKSSGGYVLVPPSTINGVAYRFVSGKTRPAPLPPRWLERLRAPATSDDDRHWSEILDLSKVVEGERDDRLTRLAGHLIAHGIGRDTVLWLLMMVDAARCDPPLGRRNVKRIVKSIAGREAKKR